MTTCNNRIWRADELEGKVWGKIEEALQKPEMIITGLELLETQAGEVDSYEGELELLGDRL
jgi:hypothetical protein